jgi:hypothetical protein
MTHGLTAAVTTGSRCEACGRLPRPRRLRLTLAKLAAVFPVEVLLHLAVLRLHPSYLVAASVLAVTTTALVVWVVEPSAMRLLRRWLHPPGRARRDAQSAPALWRIRAAVDDEAGALERLTHGLARLGANILGLHVHPLEHGILDEFVVATGDRVRPDDLVAAVESGGGRDVQVWPTTALALVDGQTNALSLSARLVADPSELPHAVAELLGARLVTDRLAAGDSSPHLLKIPSPWSGLFAFTRAGEPFTPAESARAHRLAQVAEAAIAVRRPCPD